MQAEGLQGRMRKRFTQTTMSEHDQPVAANVLAQAFVADAPNQRWVADTSEFVIGSRGKLYVAAVLDLYSRFLVGWAVSAINDRHLVIKALQMALQRRRPAGGVLHHSDQGSPYASEDYQAVLTAHGMTGSMSRRGNCFDNAVMESWFSTVKRELGEHFESCGQARWSCSITSKCSTTSSGDIRPSARSVRPSLNDAGALWQHSQTVHETGSSPSVAVAPSRSGYRRRACRPSRGDLGRQPQVLQHAPNDGGIVEDCDQGEPAATAGTGEDIQTQTAAHQLRPEVVTAVATARRVGGLLCFLVAPRIGTVRGGLELDHPRPPRRARGQSAMVEHQVYAWTRRQRREPFQQFDRIEQQVRGPIRPRMP